jgi:lactate dehydrogenase-like 2-hydroxyacid dehydrogenase
VRLRRRHGSAELDIAEAADITNMFRQASQILVSPHLRRAFIDVTEAREPPDTEFLDDVAAWMMMPHLASAEGTPKERFAAARCANARGLVRNY